MSTSQATPSQTSTTTPSTPSTSSTTPPKNPTNTTLTSPKRHPYSPPDHWRVVALPQTPGLKPHYYCSCCLCFFNTTDEPSYDPKGKKKAKAPCMAYGCQYLWFGPTIINSSSSPPPNAGCSSSQADPEKPEAEPKKKQRKVSRVEQILNEHFGRRPAQHRSSKTLIPKPSSGCLNAEDGMEMVVCGRLRCRDCWVRCGDVWCGWTCGRRKGERFVGNGGGNEGREVGGRKMVG